MISRSMSSRLLFYLVLQGLRFWVMRTLGARWTTGIIVLPGQPLVSRGPYRYLSHPNYAVVIGEIAVLPLVLGLPALAVIFTILNAVVLVIRIRAENRALAESREIMARDRAMSATMIDHIADPGEASVSDLARLHPDVPWHVHGDPRHPGGRNLAAGDSARARDLARCDELDPDRLSDRRNHRDSADGLVDARADLARGCS